MSYMSHSVSRGKEGTRDIHGLWGGGVNVKMCVVYVVLSFCRFHHLLKGMKTI